MMKLVTALGIFVALIGAAFERDSWLMKAVTALGLAVALIGAIAEASAKDVMLVLNEQEQAALRRVLDSATKSEGMQLAPITVYLLNKLNAAPEVVERKEGAQDQDKAKPQ